MCNDDLGKYITSHLKNGTIINPKLNGVKYSVRR